MKVIFVGAMPCNLVKITLVSFYQTKPCHISHFINVNVVRRRNLTYILFIFYVRITEHCASVTAGDMIAIGSQNGSVYLFRVSRDGFSYKKWNKIRGSQPLTQLDWSTDGSYLQSVTADYDLVFCK